MKFTVSSMPTSPLDGLKREDGTLDGSMRFFRFNHSDRTENEEHPYAQVTHKRGSDGSRDSQQTLGSRQSSLGGNAKFYDYASTQGYFQLDQQQVLSDCEEEDDAKFEPAFNNEIDQRIANLRD